MLAVFTSVVCCLQSAAVAYLKAENLRCEYLKDPLGIDVTQPRLSWELRAGVRPSSGAAGSDLPGALESPYTTPHADVAAPEDGRTPVQSPAIPRGVKQHAYQVLVASSPDLLKAEQADLWDSGRVESDQSVHVEYAGKPLGSRQGCWWKVRVWGQEAKPSSWSEAARWSMGLLTREDWTGKWIGLDGGEEAAGSLQGARWIWFPEGDPAITAPAEVRFFRRVVSIPAGRRVAKATVLMTADDGFTLYINGERVSQGEGHPNAVETDVTARLRPGSNTLAVAAYNKPGPPQNPAGLIGVLRVELEGAEPLIVTTDAQWRCGKTEADGWRRAGFDDSQWAQAKALGPYGMAPWRSVGAEERRRLPARYLRREFQVEKQVKRATAYVCGLGFFELYLNGRRVSDHVMDPGLSNYGKRDLYVTFDVTEYLKGGSNAVGVILGNGRFFAPRVNVPFPTPTFGYPKLLLQMSVEYEDGAVAEFVTDERWKITTNGPIRVNNEFDGEEYDARREMAGWSDAGFNDHKWQPVQLVKPPEGRLLAQMFEPMRVTEVLKPVAITNPRPGVYLADFGQNLYGAVRLKVRGPAGTRVQLRTSFTRKADGMIKMEDNRSARSTDVYILRGGDEEVWAPRFRGQGTHYAEVTGWPDVPTADNFELLVIQTDMEKTGDFTCSNDLLNRIYANVVRSARMQERSVPLDPDRDERQPWLGHPAKTSESEAYLFGVAPFYQNFLAETRVDQRADGNLSDGGSVWDMHTGNPIWPSVVTILPDWAYQFYGDRRFVEQNYEMARKWMLFQKQRSLGPDFTSTDAGGYGDWVDAASMDGRGPDSGSTSAALMNTAYIYHNCRLVARMAALLGRTNDAALFSGLAEQVQAGFLKRFFDPKTATFESQTECSYTLPLAFGLVPPEFHDAVVSNFVAEIMVNRQGHTTVGLTGMQWFMQVLTDIGHPEVAYTVATRTNRPSWGYMVSKGGSSVWERWDQDTRDPGMNGESQMILAGNLVAWMYQTLAGINYDPAQPGFKHIILRPHSVGDLSFVKAWHRSLYGIISSSWKREAGQFTLEATIPPNTIATIYVPARESVQISEGGQPARKSKSLKFLRMEDGNAVFEAGSGHYLFRALL
jgi:alpha-L-rhamnosidase